MFIASAPGWITDIVFLFNLVESGLSNLTFECSLMIHYYSCIINQSNMFHIKGTIMNLFRAPMNHEHFWYNCKSVT